MTITGEKVKRRERKVDRADVVGKKVKEKRTSVVPEERGGEILGKGVIKCEGKRDIRKKDVIWRAQRRKTKKKG